MTPRIRPALAVFLLAVPALFWQLGARALTEPDEGRCAGITAEMFRTGDWMLPHLYKLTHVNKPPLLYWLMNLAFHAGGVNEWMARMVPALAALGCVLLTVAIGRRLGEPSHGAASGLMLLTSPLFVGMARVCDYNMLLTVWVTMAFWAALAWRQDGRPWQRRAVYAACVLAMITKGPVGPAIVALGLVGERLLGPRGPDERRVWHGPSFLAALAAGMAWFVAVAARYPSLWDFFLHGEFYERIFTREHHRAEPFLFYFFILPVAVLPWLPAILLGLFRAVKSCRADSAARFVVAWLALPLLLFTLSASKMPTYVLPLLPALSAMAGRTIGEHMLDRRFLVLQCAWTTSIVAILIAWFSLYGPSWEHWHNPFTPIDAVWTAAALALGALATRFQGEARLASLAAALVITYLGLHALLAREEEALGPHTSIKHAARAIQAEAQPPDRVVLLGRYPRGLSFYLEAPVYLHRDKFKVEVPEDESLVGPYLYKEAVDVYRWFNKDERIAVITSERALNDMKAHIRKPAREIHNDGHYVVVVNY